MTDREIMQQALENCRLLASKHRKEEWAQHILRFCEEAGVRPTALRERLARCEACGKPTGGPGHIHTCSPQRLALECTRCGRMLAPGGAA